jgi:hypothetical protein
MGENGSRIITLGKQEDIVKDARIRALQDMVLVLQRMGVELVKDNEVKELEIGELKKKLEEKESENNG